MISLLPFIGVEVAQVVELSLLSGAGSWFGENKTGHLLPVYKFENKSVSILYFVFLKILRFF